MNIYLWLTVTTQNSITSYLYGVKENEEDMIVYKILFTGEDFDICIKLNTDTYVCDWYFREYNKEFDAVCRFDKI